MATLWDRITAPGTPRRTGMHWWAGDGFRHISWAELVEGAYGMTAALRRAGVAPGERVATVLTNTPLAAQGLLAVWLTGGTVASLPIPARGMQLDEYAEQIATICRHLHARALAVDAAMLPFVPETLRQSVTVLSWESLAGGGSVEPSPPGEDDVAFVQYSSGSTSMPKGCMLTARAIGTQLDMLLDMSGGVPGEETLASWLPLSHDMGVFGCLLYSWVHDFTLVLSSPERFMFNPRTWFADIATFGATQTGGTSTALHMAARAQRDQPLPRPLRLRLLALAAERVEWETIRYALQVFGPHGVVDTHVRAGYGLAEATLGVSAVERGVPPSFVAVDTAKLADGLVVEVDEDDPAATRIVDCGVPLRGCSLPGLQPDRLTEVRVQSPTLAVGYLGDPERTEAHFRNGEFLTGDLAFGRGDSLFVVGRSDDVISIGGRKVYAREIEASFDALDGVRRGCSTIVEVREGGRSRLTACLELRDELADCRRVAAAAAAVALAKAGVTLHECVFLQKGALPKTPSGKIQRYRCRELLRSGGFTPVATVELAPV